MTIALLVALIFVNAVYVWLLDRRDAREREERQTLLQRIQAPQAAVHEHHAAVSTPEPAASPLPMSDAEMAAMQQAPGPGETVEAIIARMEAIENGWMQPEDGILS